MWTISNSSIHATNFNSQRQCQRAQYQRQHMVIYYAQAMVNGYFSG